MHKILENKIIIHRDFMEYVIIKKKKNTVYFFKKDNLELLMMKSMQLLFIIKLFKLLLQISQKEIL